jgi:hypothetical protein
LYIYKSPYLTAALLLEKQVFRSITSLSISCFFVTHAGPQPFSLEETQIESENSEERILKIFFS